MASPRGQRKTPLDAALDQFTDTNDREDVLKVVHAVLATAMVESALEPGDAKSATKKAAKAECFAESIKLVEERMGSGAASAFITKKQTIFTTPASMPGVVRANDSRQTPPQTPS